MLDPRHLMIYCQPVQLCIRVYMQHNTQVYLNTVDFLLRLCPDQTLHDYLKCDSDCMHSGPFRFAAGLQCIGTPNQ